jgi:hypothetical protein
MPTLTFKVSPEEARANRAWARAENCTLSAFLRARVLEPKPARRRKLIIKKHPVSGLPYDATPGRPVAQAEIDACLASRRSRIRPGLPSRLSIPASRRRGN